MNMNDPNALLMVYCTCPDHAAAVSMAEGIVDAELAACVNIVPGLTSIYQWQGERKQGTEELLLIKTTNAAYQALQQHIIDSHPYELPEVIAVSIDTGLPAYLDWVRESCALTPRLDT